MFMQHIKNFDLYLYFGSDYTTSILNSLNI